MLIRALEEFIGLKEEGILTGNLRYVKLSKPIIALNSI